ncbi:hypothetical protein VNO78_07897 [Psophocarpus tetragonolobus]|uniref:Uncharacterized protein n=1 Tax=Psophocarpus tetragonolobus TaxID=3891 RepID=A0AAN9SWZ8_PSOTE
MNCWKTSNYFSDFILTIMSANRSSIEEPDRAEYQGVGPGRAEDEVVVWSLPRTKVTNTRVIGVMKVEVDVRRERYKARIGYNISKD